MGAPGTQARVLADIKERIERGDSFDFVHDPQYANTGVISAVPKGGLSSTRRVYYGFDRATMTLHEEDVPLFERRLRGARLSDPDKMQEAVRKAVEYMLGIL